MASVSFNLLFSYLVRLDISCIRAIFILNLHLKMVKIVNYVTCVLA